MRRRATVLMIALTLFAPGAVLSEETKGNSPAVLSPALQADTDAKNDPGIEACDSCAARKQHLLRKRAASASTPNAQKE